MEKKKIALAGNPNVGKSTVFNALTGMHQHTGNWPGKTVGSAYGKFTHKNSEITLYDLPGTYSLIAHSEEEEIARNFICFSDSDLTVVVVDAVCLERNLNLVLQIIEITDHVVVCVNLLDEAKKKKIKIDLKKLEKELGVKVIGTCARNQVGLEELKDSMVKCIQNRFSKIVKYDPILEEGIEEIEFFLKSRFQTKMHPRWLALRLIQSDENLLQEINVYLKEDLKEDKLFQEKLEQVRKKIEENGIPLNKIENKVVISIVNKAEEIFKKTVTFEKEDYNRKDRKIDRVLTSKKIGIPLMILLLMVTFWLTIVGSNYPSNILFDLLFKIEEPFKNLLNFLKLPSFIISLLVDGVYRVLAWVVAVMLPPMAIFFPIFTILEDSGYLPRIAFNLDHAFKKCSACGKQALTMCMGFGCNAVGVTGTRIIDSPREKLIAILTNSFVPCNGRFPTIISIITMFFVGFSNTIQSSILNVVLLTLIILLGIIMTFFVSKVLSKTILKGVPSSFVLELPPYRRPQFGKVIVRSIFDRTLFVLGRAIAVAAPAGLIIWMFANIEISGISILKHCANFLDPFGRILGLDGVILMSFLLGFPANEIVVPIMIMGYMSLSNITDFSNLLELKNLLVENGWTYITAICFMIFSLFHFPCSTTCLTIKKETGSVKWTILSFLLPTIIGLILCFLIASGLKLFF